MRANANLTLRGSTCALVPYKAEHVPLYHEWMRDPEIQEATASEPLSMEAEYAMQREWAEDEKKCTFIILDVTTTDTPNTGDRGMGGMAGDVNLFWNDHDDEHGTAEIEIMVAARVSRRKGIAREALRLMMSYAFYELGVKTFRAKIGFDNSASLALFRGLGYAEVSRSDMFREATMELSLTVADGAGEVVVAAAAAEGVEVEEGEKEGERFRSLLGEVWDSVVKGRYDE